MRKTFIESITDEPEEEEEDEFSVTWRKDVKQFLITCKKYNVNVIWYYNTENVGGIKTMHIYDSDIQRPGDGINFVLSKDKTFIPIARKIFRRMEQLSGLKLSANQSVNLSDQIKNEIHNMHQMYEMITPSIQLGGNMTPASPDSYIPPKKKEKKEKIGLRQGKTFKQNESITDEPEEEEEEDKKELKVGNRVKFGNDTGTVFWIRPKYHYRTTHTSYGSRNSYGRWIGLRFDRNIGGHDLFKRSLCPVKCEKGHGLFAWESDLVKIQGTGPHPIKATKQECIKWLDLFINEWEDVENEDERGLLIDIYQQFLDIYKFPRLSADELHDQLTWKEPEE